MWEIPVALSDEERRRLEELERGFAAEDPELARKLSSGPPVPASRGLRTVLTVGLGLVLLILGAASELAVVAVSGFVLMYVGALRYFLPQVPGNRFS
jgi:hypothetical protein